MRVIPVLCAALLLAPAPALAQTVPAADPPRVVDAGSRVRIAAPIFGSGREVGTVVSLTRDTLILRRGADISPRSLATSDITALEVSTGTHTRKAKGALWGLLIGVGSGAVIGYATYTKPTCSTQGMFGCINIFGPDSRGSSAAFGAAFGAIVGTLGGALLGMVHTETWAPAPVPGR
jgi:hypothetical protein